LTDKQVALIKDITAEYKNSKSDEEFLKKLQKINDRIYSLPKIEQERLFKLSAVLYYGLKEVQYLRKQGLMAPAGSFAANRPRLKSFNEDGDDDNGGDGSCVQSTSVFEISLGTKIFVDGLEHIVKHVVYSAARALFIVTACLAQTSSGPDCDDLATQCATKQWKYEDGQWIRMDCTTCRIFCFSNGYWNNTACPLN